MATYTHDHYLSWDEVHALCLKLAEQIHQSGKTFDVLVAVTRGGMFPAGIIARELDIHLVDTFCLSRYEFQETHSDQVLKLTGNYAGKNILVVDDLADKGDTLRVVRKEIQNATVATIFVKPLGKDQVDYFVQEVPQDMWIRFPWDTIRTYKHPLVSKK